MMLRVPICKFRWDCLKSLTAKARRAQSKEIKGFFLSFSLIPLRSLRSLRLCGSNFDLLDNPNEIIKNHPCL